MKVRVLNPESVGAKGTTMQQYALQLGEFEVAFKTFPRAVVPPGNYTIDAEKCLREKQIIEAGLDGRRTRTQSYIVLDIRPEDLKAVGASPLRAQSAV